ncbi:MAG: TolC family protein [Acidobacteriota bacterium]
MTKRENTARIGAALVSLLVATVLSLILPVRSQIGLSPRLDLSNAVDKAIEGNPITKSADSRVRIAEAKIRESAAGKRPSFNFSQSVVRSNNPVFVFGSLLEQGRFGPSNFAIDSLNNPEGLFNFRTQVNGQMSLFDQRQTSSRISLAEISKRQSVLMAEAARQQLRFDVIKTYFGVILERNLVTVAVDAVKTAEANRKKTQDMVDVGMTNDADRLAAEVELANAGQRKVEADGQLITTLASLNLTIGEKPDLDHELTGDLRERLFPVEDQAELIRLALENRPDYQRASLEIESSRVQKKSVRDQRLPRVEAFGNFGYSSPYVANGSTDYTIGMNLSYTLFDPGRKARIEQAVEGEVLAGLERDNLANQIRLDVIRSLQAFKTSEAKIRVSIKSIAQADEALRIIDDRYKSGLTTFNEVLRANSALVRAKQDLMTTRYEYYVNFARLLLVTGRLDDVRWFD